MLPFCQRCACAPARRRHRRLLWGGAEAAAFWGDEPGPSPSPFMPSPDPSPSPLPPSPPPGPDEPDDPYDLPDNMVIPFILLAFFLVSMAGLMSGLTLVGAGAVPLLCCGVGAVVWVLW